jgi:inorganic triphosphatase YgiF
MALNGSNFSMFETELKFQVPAARWAGLHKAVATRTAVQTRLQAMYLETAGHDLAAAGLALRLRKEGRVWVQTLKGRGDGLMQRLEHEVHLPAVRGLPTVDPALHDGTPAGQALRKALAAAGSAGRSDALQMLYRTDIQRLHRRVRHAGAVIELALDRGAIHAKGESWVDVAEIEFELVSGPPQALAELAARWTTRFDLWWDVRTKSERGFRLALDRVQVPATKAKKQTLPAGEALPHALAAMLQSALAQALPNLAELAGAPADASVAPAAAAHLHQLRVALRRLRTALSLFGDWAPEPAMAMALESRLQAVFAQLGAARDADVLTDVWLPRLQAAGAPAWSTPGAEAAADVPGLVRAPEVSALLLATLAFSLTLAQYESPAETDAPPPRRTAAQAVLRRAWRRAWADARQFAHAPVPQQHRARKRLKRLRYALEFVAPLLPAHPLKRWHRVLAKALAALGDHNDLQTARDYFASQVAQDAQAWFAVGWLSAQDEASTGRAQAALAKLKAQRRPWRKA